jgi:hypothetical protein
LDQLDQHTARAGGVDERDRVSMRAGPGHTVDEPDTGGVESGQLGDDVVCTISHVVEPLTTSLEETTYRGIRSEWLQELDGTDEGDADALLLQGLGPGTCLARQEFEMCATPLDGADGDGYVIERELRHGNGHHECLCTRGRLDGK